MLSGPRVNLEGASLVAMSHSNVASSNPTSASLDELGWASLLSDVAQSGTSGSARNFSIRCMLTYAIGVAGADQKKVPERKYQMYSPCSIARTWSGSYIIGPWR